MGNRYENKRTVMPTKTLIQYRVKCVYVEPVILGDRSP